MPPVQVAPLDETASVRVSSGAGVAVGDEGVDPPPPAEITTLTDWVLLFELQVLVGVAVSAPLVEPYWITALALEPRVSEPLTSVNPDGRVQVTVPAPEELGFSIVN